MCRLALSACIILFISGCGTVSRQEQGTRTLQRVETPTPDGGKSVKEVESTALTGETKVQSAIDLQAVVGAAVASLKGDVLGAVGNLAAASSRSDTAAQERQRAYESKVAELTSRLDMVAGRVADVGATVAGTGSKVESATKAYEDAKRDLERRLADKTAEVVAVGANTGFSSPQAQGTGAAALIGLGGTALSLLSARKRKQEAEEAEAEREQHAKAAKIASEYADHLELVARQVASMPPEQAAEVVQREVKSGKTVAQAKQIAAGVHTLVQKNRGKG